MKPPTIAIIVSDKIQCCRDFLGFNQLNPQCFKMADDIHKMHGLDKNMPVIITVNSGNDRFREIEQFVLHRFTNVRYMNIY